MSSTTSDDDENEFYDAQEPSQENGSTFSLKLPASASLNDVTGGSSSESEELNSCETPASETNPTLTTMSNASSISTVAASSDASTLKSVHQLSSAQANKNTSLVSASNRSVGKRRRRTRIPEKPNHSLNLWFFMKNCIGKDLSKIPMPVNFNEPISMLQRLTEDYEYSELLDKAATLTDPGEQLAYVAAFAISGYSTTGNRIGKPFNPLLGETYECDRSDDLGWKSIAEQVSHHPPMAAIHCDGRGWSCWQEFTMTTKFRGKYLQVVPLGNAYVEFHSTGNRFGWRKVNTTVHNIIVGKLWVDHHGDMDIIGQNAAKGYKCHLKYIPYSYFSKDSQRKVKGVVTNPDGQAKWVVNGNWDSKMESAPVLSSSGTGDNSVHKTGNYTTIWMRRMPASDCEKYIIYWQFNTLDNHILTTIYLL